MDTLPPSHQALAARGPCAVAMDGEHRKRSKYADMEPTHLFTSLVVETFGAMGPSRNRLGEGA